MAEETKTDTEKKDEPKPKAHTWTKADRDAAYEAHVVLHGSPVHLIADRAAGYETQILDAGHDCLAELRRIMCAYNRPADSVAHLLGALCRHVLRPFLQKWERRRRALDHRGSDSAELRSQFYDDQQTAAIRVNLVCEGLLRIASPTPAVDEQTQALIADLAE